MDILRNELNGIYESQELHLEELSLQKVEYCKEIAKDFTVVSKGCAVLTDASCDHCDMFMGLLGELLGICDKTPCYAEIDSSDEDIIYCRMHPEDLVDKRMLEYEFFKAIDPLEGQEKTDYIACCTLRLRNRDDNFTFVHNTTQIISPSPQGKIWLILCTYTLASDKSRIGDIQPIILNNRTGEITSLSFCDRRKHILTHREKEILLLIKEGLASKQIADRLGISIHTVNRHRQNILEKLSVSNSIEAVIAADEMRLL